MVAAAVRRVGRGQRQRSGGEARSAIWTDNDRQVRPSSRSPRPGARSARRRRRGRREELRRHPRRAQDRRGRERARRHRRRARLDGPARRRRSRARRSRRRRRLSGSSRSTRSTRSRTARRSSGSTARRRARERRPRREHAARDGPEDVRGPREAGARVQGEEQRTTSRIAVPQGRPVTRTTCTRSSRASAATSSARTRRATSTRSRSASRTRCSCKNAPLIDKWNRAGLINSKVDYDTAKNAFLKGQAAFWITGPWEADTLKTSGLRFRIVQVPKIKFRSVPFLGVQGFMVTRFANTHGVAHAREGPRRAAT